MGFQAAQKKSKRYPGKGADLNDNEEVDTTMHNIRPSAKIVDEENSLKKGSVVLRPFIPKDSNCLYRVFARTSQRLPLSISKLSSFAAYIVISDNDNKVYVWIGQSCSSADTSLAKEIALEVFQRDLRNYEAHFASGVYVELSEKYTSYLDAILRYLGSDLEEYLNADVVAARNMPPKNSEIQLFCLERDNEKLDGSMDKIEHVGRVEKSDGSVKRVDFVRINEKTIAVLRVDNQIDVWVSRGASEDDKEDALRLMGISSVDNPDVRYTLQGRERVLFRRHFKCFTDYEPPLRCIGWEAWGNNKDPTAAGKGGVSASSTNAALRAQRNRLKTFQSPHGKKNTRSAYEDLAGGSEEEGGKNGSANHVSAATVAAASTAKPKTDKVAGAPGAGTTVPPSVAPPAAVTAAATNNSTAQDKNNVIGKVTQDMLVFIEESCLQPGERADLLLRAAEEPEALVGYQIYIGEGVNHGIYVVTACAKNFLGVISYRITNLKDGDIWLRIKRGTNTGGTTVRPTRKVHKNFVSLAPLEAAKSKSKK